MSAFERSPPGPFPTNSSISDFRLLCPSSSPPPQTTNKSTKQILQELRHIDDLPVREQFKIAVLYVAAGQFLQRYVIHNNSCILVCGQVINEIFTTVTHMCVLCICAKGHSGQHVWLCCL